MDSLLITLLDRSASMADGQWNYNVPDDVKAHRALGISTYRTPLGSPKAYATMKAYNHFLQIMQYREDECTYVFAQFAQNVDLCHNGPLTLASPLPYDWCANGSHTNLWASIVALLEKVDADIARLASDEQPRNVTFIIQTDGEDQSPSLDACKAVQEHIKKGWDVLFLAAGQSAANTAGRLALNPKQIIQYDPENPGDAFDVAANLIIEHLVTGGLNTDAIIEPTPDPNPFGPRRVATVRNRRAPYAGRR